MKSKLLLGLALVLSGGLFGCSTTPKTTSDPEWVKVLNEKPYSDGLRSPFFSKEMRTAFTCEGKVAYITGRLVYTRSKTYSVLETITVELTPLKIELGVIGKSGDTIIIHFDEPFSHLGGRQLAVGNIVRVVVFTSNSGSNHPDELRSCCSLLGIKNNGTFCYSNGAKID